MNDASLRAAAAFHGHLGPWLVLGYRAGAFAARRLGGTPFERRATVWCPPAPPSSCFLDGVQLASGCTLGKANISHVARSGCRARFTRGRRSVTLALLPQAVTLLAAAAPRTEAEVEQLARRVSRLPLARLFRVAVH